MALVTRVLAVTLRLDSRHTSPVDRIGVYTPAVARGGAP